MIPFPDHLQALEGEVLIDDLQIARAFDNHVGLSAGGDALVSGPSLAMMRSRMASIMPMAPHRFKTWAF